MPNPSSRFPRCSSRATLVGQTGCFADETPLSSKAAKRGLRARNCRCQEIPPWILNCMGNGRWTTPPGCSALTCQLPAPSGGVVVMGNPNEIEKKPRRWDESASSAIRGSAALGVEKGKRLEDSQDSAGSQTPEKRKIKVAIIIFPTRSERCGANETLSGIPLGPLSSCRRTHTPSGILAIAGLGPLQCLTNRQQVCSSALYGPQACRIPGQ